MLQTDKSGFTIAGILNQYDGFAVSWQVNIYSQKYTSAKRNHDTYDREQLAIVESLKQWWHYLAGANHRDLIRCDHNNLEYIQTSKVVSRTQA